MYSFLIRFQHCYFVETDEAYVRGLGACKVNLQGILVLNKGDKPYSSKDIITKLQNYGRLIGNGISFP